VDSGPGSRRPPAERALIAARSITSIEMWTHLEARWLCAKVPPLLRRGEQLREHRGSFQSGVAGVDMPPGRGNAEDAQGVHQHAAKAREIKREDVFLPESDQ
jgi:hypothetical protein